MNLSNPRNLQNLSTSKKTNYAVSRYINASQYCSISTVHYTKHKTCTCISLQSNTGQSIMFCQNNHHYQDSALSKQVLHYRTALIYTVTYIHTSRLTVVSCVAKKNSLRDAYLPRVYIRVGIAYKKPDQKTNLSTARILSLLLTPTSNRSTSS